MSPNVAAVIPIHNEEEFMGKCIESLLNQTYGCEIFVVNDGSTDGSEKVAKSYPVSLISISRSHRAKAVNAGLKEVTAEFVLVGEGDAWYDKDYIKNSLKYFDDPKVAGTIGSGYCTNPDRDFLRKCRAVEMDLSRENYRPFTAWLFRTQLLMEIGGYDESVYWHDDVATCRKILRMGYRFAYARDAIWHHNEKTSLKGIAKQRFMWGIACAENLFKVKIVPVKEVLFSLFIAAMILTPFWTLVLSAGLYLLYFLRIAFTGKKLRSALYYFAIPGLRVYRTLFSTIGFWFGLVLKLSGRNILRYV